jgi:GDP-L-fucose synthase
MKDEVLRAFSKKNVLVTGGTGMIGRQIVRILCEAGANIRSVSLDNLSVHPAAEYVFGDLADFGFCKEITSDMDYVFHVAGIKGSIEVTKTKPASFFVPLLMMNTNVLEACRINKVQKVVYTSSIGAYPNAEVLREFEDLEAGAPMDMFPGWAKRMAELQIRAYKIQYGLDNFAIVRPCNVYGPGDNFDPKNAMVIPSLMCRIYHKEDPVVVWGDGSAIRDFAYSEDIAKGVILALYYGTGGRYVNLGSGKGYSIKELVETLHSFLDFNYEFDTAKPSGFPKRVMNISLAREMLGYNPTTSLLEGLKKTWEWYVENQDECLKKVNYFKE